jgi:hypothetical protein
MFPNLWLNIMSSWHDCTLFILSFCTCFSSYYSIYTDGLVILLCTMLEKKKTLLWLCTLWVLCLFAGTWYSFIFCCSGANFQGIRIIQKGYECGNYVIFMFSWILVQNFGHLLFRFNAFLVGLHLSTTLTITRGKCRKEQIKLIHVFAHKLA